MKTIKEIEDDIGKKWHYGHLETRVATLKDVLGVINEIHTTNKVGLAILNELKKRING